MKAHIMVRYTVADFDKWLEVFESTEALREANGGKEWRVFRNEDKPDELIILLDWTDFEQARAYVQLPELVEVMSKAGVTSEPEVTFVDEVKKYKPGG